MTPESRALRDAFRRHIEFPGVADAPPSPSIASPSSGGSEAAPGIPLDRGGVWARPAYVGRMVLRQRVVAALAVFVVAAFIASGFLAALALLSSTGGTSSPDLKNAPRGK